MNTKQTEALKLARQAILQIAGAMPFPVGQKALAAIDEALADSALDRMAENARELGLDYEPPCKTGSQCTSKCPQCEQPAQQQEPVGKVNELFDEAVIEQCGFNRELLVYTSPPASKPWGGSDG